MVTKCVRAVTYGFNGILMRSIVIKIELNKWRSYRHWLTGLLVRLYVCLEHRKHGMYIAGEQIGALGGFVHNGHQQQQRQNQSISKRYDIIQPVIHLVLYPAAAVLFERPAVPAPAKLALNTVWAMWIMLSIYSIVSNRSVLGWMMAPSI